MENLTVGSEPQAKEVGEQRVVSFSLAVNRKTSSGKQQTPVLPTLRKRQVMSRHTL